jgi:hypothetical protein
MNLKEILSISGKSGLFKTIAQTKNGVIVESLLDGKRIQAFASDKISSLGEISIFTTSEDKPLAEVLTLIFKKTSGEKAPDAKSTDALVKSFFEEVLPDYDTERVYISHMRKIYSWFNLLVDSGITEFSSEKSEEINENDAPNADTPVG